MAGKKGNGRPKTIRFGWIGDDGIGRIPLTKNKVALVDPELVEQLSQFAWHLSSKGYAGTAVKVGSNQYQQVRMHRVIMGSPVGIFIDHINRDRLDNRRANLRLVNNSQNIQNSGCRKTKNRTSQYRGVDRFNNTSNKIWKAQANLNGTKTYLGCYETEIEAALAYDAFIHAHGDKYAYLNFPD